jgi:hypothetical protein
MRQVMTGPPSLAERVPSVKSMDSRSEVKEWRRAGPGSRPSRPACRSLPALPDL